MEIISKIIRDESRLVKISRDESRLVKISQDVIVGFIHLKKKKKGEEEEEGGWRVEGRGGAGGSRAFRSDFFSCINKEPQGQ